MFKRNIKKVISLTMAVVISAASISLTGCSITDIRQLRGKNNNSYDTQYSYNTTDNEEFTIKEQHIAKCFVHTDGYIDRFGNPVDGMFGG